MKHVKLILLAAGVAVIACRETPKQEQTDSTIAVKVIQPSALSTSRNVTTSGSLASENEAYLSFKVGGIIREVTVHEGDAVRKGQVLATLNTTEAAALASQAEENFLKARRDAARVNNLFRDSVNTREQLDNSQTALLVAEKQLDIARFNLSQTKITAPNDGVVIKKMHSAGEQVQGGTAVLYVSGNRHSDWIVKCGLTDIDWARLRGGEKAEIVFDAFPQKLSGSVKSLAQGTDPASGLYQAEIRVNGKEARLAAGLFARVTIFPKQKSDMLAVPMDALLEGENDSAFVFVADGNKAFRRPVKVAYLQGGRAMIASGIDAGASVIREGSAYLADGAAIEIVR